MVAGNDVTTHAATQPAAAPAQTQTHAPAEQTTKPAAHTTHPQTTAPAQPTTKPAAPQTTSAAAKPDTTKGAEHAGGGHTQPEDEEAAESDTTHEPSSSRSVLGDPYIGEQCKQFFSHE